MGYKLLGFAVWRGARWYVSRRVSALPTPPVALAAAGAGLLVVGLGARRATA